MLRVMHRSVWLALAAVLVIGLLGAFLLGRALEKTIVVTTPNYYALRGRAHAPMRFLRGGGGGLPVDSLIREPTFAHHWKEYSLKELVHYFTLLSPDFRIAKALCVRDYNAKAFVSIPGRIFMAIESALPFLRPQLHLEVALAEKRRGVIADPTW